MAFLDFLRPKPSRNIEIPRGSIEPETVVAIERDVLRAGDSARADMNAAQAAAARGKEMACSIQEDMIAKAAKARLVATSADRIADALGRMGRREKAMADTILREVSVLTGLADEIASGTNRTVASLEGLVGTLHVICVSTNAASEEIDGLSARFVAGMRQNMAGDRRNEERYPVRVQVEVIEASGRPSFSTHTVDLSLSGALIGSPDGFAIAPGTPITLSFADVGRVEAIVTATSPLGIHCRYPEPAETRAAYAAMIDGLEADYFERIGKATMASNDVAHLIETAVSRSELDEASVFDDAYESVAPGLYGLARGKAMADLLAPALKPLVSPGEGAVACMVVDRNGFVLADDIAPCKSWEPLAGRILADRPGIVAARSTRPFVLQAHSVLGPEPRRPLREIAVPLRIFGRHWGALRVVFAD